MTLYHKVKSHLQPVKAAISDDELLVLNRKDYHQSQISGLNAWINELGIKIGYPYRLLLSLVDQIAAGCVSDDFNIILSDPSLTVAALYAWIRAGGSTSRGRIYAPNGIAKLGLKESLVGELLQEFERQIDTRPDSRPDDVRIDYFTFVIGNTKNSSQTTFAVDRFCEIKSGFLILKDYARIDAADEREYMESRRVFPSITLEGHAYVLKKAA